MAFDRFLIHTRVAGHRKVRRLKAIKDGRWCYLTGILGLAAESPERGVLLISEGVPAAHEDIADHADVSVKVARATVAAALEVGLLHDRDGAWQVHDWDDWNPSPKASDGREAQRERKRRSRAGHADVTRESRAGHADVTPQEARASHVNASPFSSAFSPVSVEEKERFEEGGASQTRMVKGKAQKGHANVTRDPRAKRVSPSTSSSSAVEGESEREREFSDFAADHAQVTGSPPPKTGTKARAARLAEFTARREEGWSLDDLKDATIGAFTDSYRREHGHYDLESVLRPTKVDKLVNKGRRAAAGPLGATPTAADRGVTDMLEAARRLREEDAA